MKNIDKIYKAIQNVKEHEWDIVNLKNCGLTEIPKELFNYPNLVSIDLSNTEYCEDRYRNQITEIPDEISNLNRLSRLNIKGNSLEKISDNISHLHNLKYLNLEDNNLRQLPEQVANMSALDDLLISGNPFDILPPEIAARGLGAIRNFFIELKESDFLYEVKLLIVGEGRVGKTCLSKALINDEYDLEDEVSTEGININSWIIPKEEIKRFNPKIERDFQINIWDFGGQEIYHSTHQFFLTKRSLYLLVTESRKEDSHDDFYYWLNIVKILGDNSPVVMVLNKCDQPTKDIPIKEYQSTFNNIIAFDKISLKNEKLDIFKSFKEKLIEHASKLDHIGNPLPKVWIDIRKELEEFKLQGKNHIKLEEYLDICKKHYRDEESAMFLAEYFHDLGVIMHFNDDMTLANTIILNHEWITRGVYKVLDDPIVIEKKGRFNVQDINRIWSDNEFKFKTPELISLMKNTKFDLCFELKGGEFLVPRLLPVDEVEHKWDSFLTQMKFVFKYKFMPKGILARLIVKMNKDILGDNYWRYGVILSYENTTALIREKYFENRIVIEMYGDNIREFLFLIRKNIHEINKDFNKLDCYEKIPCNCEICKDSENPYYHDFDVLRRYELNEIPKIRCNVSLIEVEVYDLTSNIIRKSLNEERTIVCENKNAEVLTTLNIKKTIFYPETNSNSVFMKVYTKPDVYGLRDKDFLLKTEVAKLKSKLKNYYILDYYCFENYLYHPDNIDELRIDKFNKQQYVIDIKNQKNKLKNIIISNFKSARSSYQELRVENGDFSDKKNESIIIDSLESDSFDVFYEYFSMKDHYDKKYLEKFQLKQNELASTKWFRDKIIKIIDAE